MTAEETELAKGSPPGWKRYIGRVAFSVIVLCLLFFFLPREPFIRALSGFSVSIWIAGVSIYLCLHLIGVMKWRMLMNAAGAGLGFAQVARCYYYGLFGNVFLPSVVGGDVVRAGLAMKQSQSGSAVLSGSIMDRTIDSLALALIAGAGLLLIPTALDENSRAIFWRVALLITVSGGLLVLVLFMLPAHRLPNRVQEQWRKFRKTFVLLLRRPGKMVQAMFFAITLQVSMVAISFWLGTLALMQNATFLMWMFVWPLAKLAAMVPVTLGGIGVREAAQGALFLPFGVSIEKAVAAGLMFQVIVIAGNLIGGLIVTLIGRFERVS